MSITRLSCFLFPIFLPLYLLESKHLRVLRIDDIQNAVFGEEYNKIFIIDKEYNMQESEKLTKNEIANLIISRALKLHEEIYAKNYNRKSITI